MAEKLTKALWRELTEVAAGIPPGDMRAEKSRVVLKRNGLVYRNAATPWTWHLTPAGRAAIASQEQDT